MKKCLNLWMTTPFPILILWLYQEINPLFFHLWRSGSTSSQELLPVDAVNFIYWKRTVYFTNVNYRLNFHWPCIHVNEWDPHANQNNTVSLEVGLSQTLCWLISESRTQPRKERKKNNNNKKTVILWFLGFSSFNLSNYEEFVSGFFLTEFNMIIVFLLSCTQHWPFAEKCWALSFTLTLVSGRWSETCE